MDFPSHLSTGFLPFLDDYTSGNLAPIAEEQSAKAQTVAADQYDRIYLSNDRHHSQDDGDAPSSKRQKHLAYRCEPCDKSYTEKRALARHKHSELHRRNIGLPPLEKYHCSFGPCSKTFSRNHDRRRHEDEAHRGLRRTSTMKASPDSGPAVKSKSPEGKPMEYEEERTVIFEDEDILPQNGWDQFWTKMEILPGPANWISSGEEKSEHVPSTNVSPGTGTDQQPSRKDSGSTSGKTHMGTSTTEGRSATSWFMEEDSEDEGGPVDSIDTVQSRPETQLSVEDTNSRSDSAIDMIEESSSVCHEPKRPSITTIDYRQEQAGEESTVSTVQFEKESMESLRTFTLPARPKVSVIQGRGKPAQIPPKKPLVCAFCDEPFEENESNLLVHLRQHLNTLRDENANWCKECQVGFVHKNDLDKHRMNADLMGHCSFRFDHKRICRGHHPPRDDPPGFELTDRDRFLLCKELREWEFAQLRAYIAEINVLVEKHNSARASTSYSIEELFRKERSRDSISSYAISVNTYGSAPCDRVDGQLDVKGIGHRMKMLSLKSSTMQVRRTARKLPHMLRSGGSLSKALYNAATSGDRQQIGHLVTRGADVNGLVGDRTILSAAAEWGDADTVKLLIDLGAQVDAQEAKYGTALASAAYAGNIDTYKMLLAEGARVSELGGRYGCALGAAAATGNIEVARMLIQDGADVNQQGGECSCPLGTAAARGHVEMVQLLVDYGAETDQPGGDEGSPLGFAVYHGHEKAARILISYGANVNCFGRKRGNPLCAAIVQIAKGRGSINMVRLLLESGADADQKGSANPLRTAASNADVRAMAVVVKLLLEYGAQTQATGGAKGNALHLAKQRRQYWMEKKPFMTTEQTDEIDDTIGYCYEVIRLLREAGATDDDRRSNSFSRNESR